MKVVFWAFVRESCENPGARAAVQSTAVGATTSSTEGWQAFKLGGQNCHNPEMEVEGSTWSWSLRTCLRRANCGGVDKSGGEGRVQSLWSKYHALVASDPPTSSRAKASSRALCFTNPYLSKRACRGKQSKHSNEDDGEARHGCLRGSGVRTRGPKATGLFTEEMRPLLYGSVFCLRSV